MFHADTTPIYFVRLLAKLRHLQSLMKEKVDHVYNSLLQYRATKAKIRREPVAIPIHLNNKAQSSDISTRTFHPATERDAQDLSRHQINDTTQHLFDETDISPSHLELASELVGYENIMHDVGREHKMPKYSEYGRAPDSCFDGLRSEQHFHLVPEDASSQGPRSSASNAPTFSGSAVAHLFAEQAVTNLSEEELHSLLQFFANASPRYDEEHLVKHMSAKLEQFYTAEIQLTKEARARLAKPSGQPSADLGLIMHCQSKEGDIGELWDMESQSIQLLAKKGLNPGLIFGYDWHWRAEGYARLRKGNCPATKWSEEKRHLHNAVSREILNILPLPLLIVAGACAKKHYQMRLQPATRRLTITLVQGIHIAYDLDFQYGALKRITTYVDHPSASFFRPSGAAEVCVRLDAALNFFLWLLGIEHEERTFTETQASHRRGVPGAAPLAELHEYNKREQKLKRHLLHHEYDPGFLSWAARYLDDDVFAMLDRGESVAKALRRAIDLKISTKRFHPDQILKHAAANRLKNARRYRFEFKEFWDGQEVKVHKNGYLRLYVSATKPALRLWAGKHVFAACEERNTSAVIKFSQEGLCLMLGSSVVFERTRLQLLQMKSFGSQWIEQLEKELARKN